MNSKAGSPAQSRWTIMNGLTWPFRTIGMATDWFLNTWLGELLWPTFVILMGLFVPWVLFNSPAAAFFVLALVTSGVLMAGHFGSVSYTARQMALERLPRGGHNRDLVRAMMQHAVVHMDGNPHLTDQSPLLTSQATQLRMKFRLADDFAGRSEAALWAIVYQDRKELEKILEMAIPLVAVGMMLTLWHQDWRSLVCVMLMIWSIRRSSRYRPLES